MSSSGLDGDIRPKIGIIGGSGMCAFPELSVRSRRTIETKYGAPSGDVLICEHEGVPVAFLPRHGEKHSLPPHKVPYKANLAALKCVGVEHVIGTCVVGSLKEEIGPESFVMFDQFVNLTWGRDDSFSADGGFMHIPMGEPYCRMLRSKLASHAANIGFEMRDRGTVAVIQGPRFSTRAESAWFKAQGWDAVNMTQYPECYFARELGLCYACIASVTDYDAWYHESTTKDEIDAQKFLKIFRRNTERTKAFLLSFIAKGYAGCSCGCADKKVRAYYEQ